MENPMITTKKFDETHKILDGNRVIGRFGRGMGNWWFVEYFNEDMIIVAHTRIKATSKQFSTAKKSAIQFIELSRKAAAAVAK
jgi:hypothetical protein